MHKVKMGELPGDIPRRVKIAMMERPLQPQNGWCWAIPIGAVRSFRRDMKRKTVKVERRRAREEAAEAATRKRK